LPSKVLVLDLKNVIYMDVSGMDALLELHRNCQSRSVQLVICGLAHQPYEMAKRGGLFESLSTHDIYPELQEGITAAIQQCAN
jgi:SulP family sulfate permease